MHPHDALVLARELVARHGLTGWSVRLDHARRRFGCCHYSRKLITLSRPLVLLNEEAQVRDTILHEIAHALTPGAGHGARWKRRCVEIGAKPVRCYTDASVRSPARGPARFRIGCPSCDWWVDRRRRSRRRFACTRCRTELVWQERVAVAD